MLLKQFCLSHQLGGVSMLSVYIDTLRQKGKEVSPRAFEPKLGNHITLLPPFRAHVDEMRNFSVGLSIAGALYGTPQWNEVCADVHGIDFFLNPGSDALVLKVELPENYRRMVEQCRRELSKFNEWTFPVVGDCYVPHICVLEGVGLYENVRTRFPAFEKYIPGIRIDLPFPKIMVKVKEGDIVRWEEFVPST